MARLGETHETAIAATVWQRLKDLLVTAYHNLLPKFEEAFRLCDSPIEIKMLQAIMMASMKIAPTFLLMGDEDEGHIIVNFGFPDGSSVAVCPQKDMGRYRMDFSVAYMIEEVGVEICVECDGHEFHAKTQEQVSRDKQRDRDLLKRVDATVRWTGKDITSRECESLASELAAILSKRMEMKRET
jgi:very-short-patch-repair endonuclease